MIILGIDPGIARTGWGVIEIKNESRQGGIKIKNCGCYETSPNTPIGTRIVSIYEFTQRLIREFKPEEIAVEELFFNTNTKTALIVGQARGVVLLAGAQHNLPIAVYTPLQVKIAVTGYGRAEKIQVGQMVKTILKLSSIPKPDDTTDAVAVALTHAFSRKINQASI